MSFVKLYAFNVSTDVYDIYGDFDTLDIQTRLNGTIITSGPTFTSDDTGFEDNDVVKQQCEGFTLQRAEALLAFPYAVITETANATFCGYAPPSTTCDYVIGIVTKNAINETASGRINVNVSPGGAYEYSLDGLNFQSSNFFTNLPADTYTLYVRRTDGSCEKNRPVTVAKTEVDVSDNFFTIPYQDSKHLYYFFRLVIDGVATDIREPIKWDGINIFGERDPNFHGYKFKYTENDVTLGFDCDSGKGLIEDVYKSKGQDGEVFFKYGFSYFGVENILFPGKLDLSTYKWYADRVECSVQVDDFDATFLSRLETKVAMDATESFSGEEVIPPGTYPLPFHAKVIKTSFASSSDEKSATFYQQQYDHEYSIFPDTTENVVSDLDLSTPWTFNVLTGSAKALDEYHQKFTYAGNVEIAFNWNYSGTVTILNGAVSGNVWGIDTVFVYQQYNPVTEDYSETITFIGQSYTDELNNTVIGDDVTLDEQTVNFTQNVAFTTNLTVGENDKIYFYTFLSAENPIRPNFEILEQTNADLSVIQYQEAESTTGEVWFLDDAIRQTLNVVADNKYVFRSNLFERAGNMQLVDGCASQSALTNGFQIRKFDKPLVISFKTIIDSLNAMYCIGVGYSTVQNVSMVRFERRDHFYQNKEILTIEIVDQYHEEVAKEIIYNDLKFGYKTYQADGFNSLDEFNTEREAITPIQKNKAALEFKSDLITSGYSIENSRRYQFAEKPTESATNDDAAFFVALTETDGAYTAEKDEAFSIVNNLISPETSYNLRVSPMRMLFNWFIWLKGIFAYKTLADTIRNTFYVQNGEMQTQFKSTETCPLGDVNKELITENEDLTMQRLLATPNIYRPEWVYVKCRLTPDRVQVLNHALQGQFGSEKDHGYIMVKRPEGNYQAGWVYNLTYNYATEACTIKMLKKFYTPQPIDEDCCDWLIANGCYVLANGERLIA